MTTTKVSPIRPEHVGAVKLEIIPPEVITVFNHLIAQHYDAGSSTFTQDEVIVLLQNTLEECPPRAEIFANGWLKVEQIYEVEGWEVEYDKPGYNETYNARFTFRKRGRQNGL